MTYSDARPEANESKPKRMKRRITSETRSRSPRNERKDFRPCSCVSLVSFLSPRRGCVSSVRCCCCCFDLDVIMSASTLWLKDTDKANLRAPIAAYARKIVRQAGMYSHPHSLSSRLIAQPQAITPRAVPAVPKSEYQSRMSRRNSLGVRWASVDSSTALKGPISLPLRYGQHIIITLYDC